MAGDPQALRGRVKDAEYTLTQDRLLGIAQWIAETDLDLDTFLDRIALAEGVAPILDPTAFLRGADRLDAVRNIARAARDFRDAARAGLRVLQRPVPGAGTESPNLPYPGVTL